MVYGSGTPPERIETAGLVDELEGDVDREINPTSNYITESGEDPDFAIGGTPGDAAGEMGAAGSS